MYSRDDTLSVHGMVALCDDELQSVRGGGPIKAFLKKYWVIGAAWWVFDNWSDIKEGFAEGFEQVHG